MAKMIKRILSMVLSLALLLSFVPATVWAADDVGDLGNVNGGKLNMGDVATINYYVRNAELLDEQQMKLADCNLDGRIDMGDVARLAAHITGTLPLTNSTTPAYSEGMFKVVPSTRTACIGDTVDFTVYCNAVNITAAQFTLVIPEGMTYVPGSATVPRSLKSDLGWSSTEWTESSMMWTGYYYLSIDIEEDTAFLTYQCTVDAMGEHAVCLENALVFNNAYGGVEANVTVDTVIAWECSTMGHNYALVETMEPTCTEGGYTLHTCPGCGSSYQDSFVEPTGHRYAETVIYPSCTVGGYSVFSCENCDYSTQGNDTDPTGHYYISEVIPPECMTEGYTLHECVYCGGSYQDAFTDPTGHSYSSKVTLPTCTQAGYTTYTCSACGDAYQDDQTAAAGHKYVAAVTEPTCTERGYTTYRCSVCGNSYKDDYTEPTGHFYSSKVTAPTCIQKGYTTYTCTVCWDRYQDDYTPATGHQYVATVTPPTCVKGGYTIHQCTVCGDYYRDAETEPAGHKYVSTVTPPTYLAQGYTTHVCSVCEFTCKDTYVDPLERTPLANATLRLEYTSAFYKGTALTPNVTLFYDGKIYTSSEELKITYANNNQVGIATVTVEGINQFEGTATLQFEITYESVPERIVNVIAVGEIGKVSLAWGMSNEVSTGRYKIYRKAENESEYQYLTTIYYRNVLTFEDKNVEKGKTYSYYVTGVGLYGAESEPSMVVSATVEIDQLAPTVLKFTPAAASIISGKTTLSVTATDNIGVTKVAYFYSVDSDETWLTIGETTNKALDIVFDTTALESESIKVKAIAYDAEGNASTPLIVTYSLDNVGPEKVTGLSAVTLSSKITLLWNDVTSNDAAYFILQKKSGEAWNTVASKITTLGHTITGLQPDTDYVYRVACVDTHGNIGEYSDEFTARTAVDDTAPVITSQSPNSARYNSTIKFSATAKDDCDVETIEIQVSADLSSWTTISTNTYTARTYKQTYTYAIDLSSYAEGSIFVRAIATDFSGNRSDTSDTAPYTEYIVDKTAPEAPAGVSANGNDGYITVSWTMGSEADLGKYFVYKSTSLDGNYQLVASNLSTLNYHDRDVQSGSEFYYKVRVSDACGNMSEYSSAASATMASDTKKPEITSISATYQQKISPSSHTINVAATDNNKLSYVVVEYCTSVNAQYVQLAKVDNLDIHYKSVSIVLPIDGLTDGDMVYVRAYAVDMAGLQSQSATAEYTLDTTAPMTQNYQAVLDGTTVNLSWNDCGDSDLAGFKVYRSEDGASFTLLGSRSVNNAGKYSFVDVLTAKESASYDYKLVAVDRLGNTAFGVQTVHYTYVYVNQKPVARMNIPEYMTLGVEEVLDASDSSDDIAIMSYLWDFGDGTTSTEMKPVKRYDAVGTYHVTLTVTDNEGITSTITGDIEVKEREQLGTLNVKVVDENGRALSYVPVYFDLGSDNQKVVYTNASGVATLQMINGTHTIGMYASGYLPVKKDVVVLSNAIRTVTLTTVEEDIVTGNFEITRMNFDEIVAAGIDIYDPANQNVYSATVRVTYGSTPPMTIDYVRNDDKILSYSVKDSNGKPVKYYVNSNGESRKITGVVYIPVASNADVVAIIDIPASASYLKEFFDVRLHIINNASSEFVLEKNEVVLNVPEGMTLMSSVSGDYATTNTVQIGSLKGQETVTVAWVLRGDKAGEYNLSADFTGTLAEFNELVTARFETEEPIKVYGLEGVKFRILAADEIHNDTLYFNVELENERDIDIYMPSIGVTDKIKNVTESVLHNNTEGDFLAGTYILNAYVQTRDGKKQYVPVTFDSNGRATTDIKTLAPGQKIVYEYVAYNAINYEGVAYFKDAAILEFEGILDNIEVGSFHRELYSFQDYSEKLDAILSGIDPEVAAAYTYITNDDNYYYVGEAKDGFTNVCQILYGLLDIALSGDIGILTQEDERALVEEILLEMLCDSSAVDAVDKLIAQKYVKSVKSILSSVKLQMINRYEDYSEYWGTPGGSIDGEDPKFPLDEFPPMEGKDPNAYFDEVFNTIKSDEISLAMTYMRDGEEALKKSLQQKLQGYGIGLALNELNIDMKAPFRDQLTKARMLTNEVLDAFSATEQDAYVYAVLKLECNAEYCNYVLDALIQNTADVRIIAVASELKETLNTTMSEYEYKVMSFAENFASEMTKYMAQDIIKGVMDSALSATPAVLLKVIKLAFDAVNMDSFYKQQGKLDVYNNVSRAMAKTFADAAPKADTLQTQAYAMCILKSLCETRLAGEAEFNTFMHDYLDGKYAVPLKEEKIIKEINEVKNTGYTTLAEWWDAVQYNILHSRDILFNIEGTSSPNIPSAPVVILDYEKLQTIQSYTPEYEYCFADGVWKPCANEPIAFEVDVVPGTLRVRKAANDETLAGKVTTVKIYARKDLSKLISVRFDGVNYWIDNLSTEYDYQIIFLDSQEDQVDWSKARTVSGSDDAVKISGIGAHTYMLIRSCQNDALYETTSNPLSRTVSIKQKLDLKISGSGTVAQSDRTGYYFYGDSVELTASTVAGSEFLGWNVNGTCVSTDEYYLVEMTEDLEVTAMFTGSNIRDLSISKMPQKMQYLVGEDVDVSGMEVTVTYEDGTVMITEHYTAQLTNNAVGATQVAVSFGGKTVYYDVMISGETDPEEKPVVLPTLTLNAPTLEFKDMIKIVAFFTAENIDDVVEMGMVTYNEEVAVVDINTATYVISSADYDNVSNRYFASSQGIHAKCLGDTVYLACYAKLSDGTYVYTKLAHYSAVDYATNLLKNENTDMKLKQLVVAMLNYGAAAQSYFGYNTDVLANTTLTGDQKQLPEGYRGDMVDAVPTVDAAKQGTFANNKGFSARKPAVSFEGTFCINYFFTPAYIPVDGITLYYWTETDFGTANVLTVDNATGDLMLELTENGQYRGDIGGIAAKNLSDAIYVAAIYSDGTTTWTSGVLGYSIRAYCGSLATKGGTMTDLAMATAVYGYHAQQYFG